MLFNSFGFAVFLPIVFVIYWALPNPYRWALLLAASYGFYMSWNVKYVGLILLTTCVSYYTAILLERSADKRRRRAILFCAVFICIGVLFIFKYFSFFFDTVASVLNCFSVPVHPMTLRLLLPVGISFYTFQSLSYVIDVYRGETKAEHHLGIYATFVSFFPQLVAGPIERTNNLLPQIAATHQFDYSQATYGLKLMAWGYYKKLVIADFVSAFVDKVFNNITSYHGFALVLAVFFFTIQIYCDFSAYSDIARGTAKLFGIELMENFKSPYFSSSLHEFWSRWHISLSTWFRDYVYIPLGGNRVSRLRHYRNLLFTFLISGLWHGANWTYIVWGGIHGVAQIAESIFGSDKRSSRHAITKAVRVLLVFVFTMLAWVFFRAENLGDALYWFRHVLDGAKNPLLYVYNGFSGKRYVGIGLSKRELLRFILCLSVMTAFDFSSLKNDVINWISKRNVILRWAVYLCFIWIIIFLSPKKGSAEFVYFQF